MILVSNEFSRQNEENHSGEAQLFQLLIAAKFPCCLIAREVIFTSVSQVAILF